MLRGASFLFFLMASLGIAQADPPGILELYGPPPSSGEVSGDQQNQSSSVNTEPNREQRGAEQSPLFVRVLDDENNQAEAEALAKEREKSAAVERRLAAETKRLADYTLALAIFTFILALVAIGQAFLFYVQLKYLRQAANDARLAAEAAKDSAVEAGKANTLSRETMIADQRPWVSLDITIDSELAYDSVGWDAGKRWHIQLNYTLKNHGKTPALNVSFLANILPGTLATYALGDDTEMEKLFGTLEGLTDANFAMSRVLFPGEIHSEDFGINGDPARFDPERVPHTYTGQFRILACVSYRSTLDDTLKGRTAKTFILYKGVGSKQIDLKGETIHPTELGFVLSPISGSYAR